LRESVKDAAGGRWIDVLVDVAGIPRELLDGQHHPCPRCGGTDRFRLIDEEAGAVLCNQCFNTKNGDGISAVMWMLGCSFQEARDRIASYLGLEVRTRREPLELQGWNPAGASLWLPHKPGITLEALERAGAQVGRFRDRATVITLPILLEAGGGPRGWIMWDLAGGNLPSGRGTSRKMLALKGSRYGWVGRAGLEALEEASTVWKVEGPTDMLALAGIIPEYLRRKEAVLSNAFGASESPDKYPLEALTGKHVFVCGDRDDVGRRGALRWAQAAAGAGAVARLVEVPRGAKDIRALVMEAGTAAALDELEAAALAAPTVDPAPRPSRGRRAARRGNAGPPAPAPDEPEDFLPYDALGNSQDGAGELPPSPSSTPTSPSPPPAAAEDPEGEEGDDDPSRLAREFLRGRRVVTYRDETYYYRDGQWVIVPRADLKADVTLFVRKEFHRINCEELANSRNREGIPPRVHKIGSALISSVIGNVKAYSCVSASVHWGSELPFLPNHFEKVDIGVERQWVSVSNGILMVDAIITCEKQVLREHDATWFSPNKLPYPYDPTRGSAERPLWENFLEKNLEGDSGRIAQLQEWMGYCLIPLTSLQKFIILEGEGANGKSVYCAVLEAILGRDNVSHVPLEMWAQRFSLSPTIGKLANIITEVGELDRVAEGFLKAFVCGEAMTIDRKGLDPIHSNPSARLVIACNNRPRFSDRSGGLWRRMLLVPFDVTIAESEQVRGMDKPEWWIRSGELSAILNWALEGLLQVLRNGFTETQEGKDAIEDYRREANPAREFLLERYEEIDGAEVESQAVYVEYRNWCEASGHRPLGSRLFGKEVRRAFPKTFKHRMGPRDSRFYILRGISKRIVIDPSVFS
jgi:P4 family phage/plasmid primase-like protien